MPFNSSTSSGKPQGTHGFSSRYNGTVCNFNNGGSTKVGRQIGQQTVYGNVSFSFDDEPVRPNARTSNADAAGDSSDDEKRGSWRSDSERDETDGEAETGDSGWGSWNSGNLGSPRCETSSDKNQGSIGSKYIAQQVGSSNRPSPKGRELRRVIGFPHRISGPSACAGQDSSGPVSLDVSLDVDTCGTADTETSQRDEKRKDRTGSFVEEKAPENTVHSVPADMGSEKASLAEETRPRASSVGSDAGADPFVHVGKEPDDTDTVDEASQGQSATSGGSSGLSKQATVEDASDDEGWEKV